MNTVKVNRIALLSKLRQNRETHLAEFVEASVAYRQEAIASLKAMLAQAQDQNSKVPRHLSLPEPSSHVEDYDRVIGMLEMSVEDVVELDQHEFRTYVQDEWNWKQATSLVNATYLRKA